MKKIISIVLVGLLAVSGSMAGVGKVKSPDGEIAVSFDIKKGSLVYSVSKGGTRIVGPSTLEIIKGAKMKVVDRVVRERDSSWKPVWGQFSEIRDHHRELELSLETDGVPVTLQCRAFDTGIGIRFVLSEESEGKELLFRNEYKVLDGVAHYAGQRGIEVVMEEGAGKKASVPLVTERLDGVHVGLIESDLYSARGFGLMKGKIDETETSFVYSSSAVSSGEGQVTAWRTILIGESAGDLALNTVALNLAAPCKVEDTSWIQPGKGLWDWRVHGYDNGDFKYDINTRSFLRYIDFCADQGIEYFTIDDNWFLSAENGKMVVSPDVDIKAVMTYAKEKGVMIMLYYDRHKGDFGDDSLFEYYADLGATGMKYGFMGNKADFTRNAMEAAAENRLLINFHDGPVPMSGVERTFPNLITREYCHGQQDSRSAFTPETFLRMAFVSALSGPLDMSNGNFGIRSINAGERKKGPRELNSYISTVVSEVARCLVIYTGLVTLPDAPEEYLKKADLFEFMKVMPATWDDSLVLHSKIGEYITVARRSGETWFVGSVNNQTERTLEVLLDFLEAGKKYAVTLYQDAADTDGLKKQESYEITTKTVMKGDVVEAKMAVGGGHAMIVRPVKSESTN